MSDNEIQLEPPPNSANGTEDGNEQPLHRFAVAVLFVKKFEDAAGEKCFDTRQMMLSCESEDQGGAEWMGRKLCEGDNQLPGGFVFASAVALEIPYE